MRAHRLWVGSVVVAATMLWAAPVSAADGALVFEPGASPPGHTARIAWHLLGSNIDNPSVTEAWYSGYLAEPGSLTGMLVADPGEGTLTGSLVETWDVGGAYGDWTQLEMKMTAAVVGGRLRSDGDGWVVSGEVGLSYSGKGSVPETPSTCGEEECYICAGRVCTFTTTGSSTVPLSGRLDGTTLTLSFSDGLLEDIEQVNVSGLQDQEYFLSLFTVTLPNGSPAGAGGIPPAPPPPAGPTEGAPAASGEEASPGAEVPPEAEAAVPAGEEVSAATGEVAGSGEPPQAVPQPSPSGKRWPITVWLVLFLGVAGGAVGVWIAMKGVLMLRGSRGMNPLLTTPKEVAHSIEKAWEEGVDDPEPSFIEYEQDVEAERRERFVKEMLAPPAGPAPPPAAPGPSAAPAPPPATAAPSPPAEPPPPPPFEPAHEIVLGEDVEHNRVPGIQTDGTRTTTTLMDAGTPVQVMGEDGDHLLIRNARTRSVMRVHKSGVRPTG